MLLPLARLNARLGEQYFPSAPDPARESYWQPPTSRTGGVLELAPGTDAPALLAQVAAFWTAAGDRRLASLLPELLALREAMLAGPASGPEAADVSISVYPLF